MKAAIPVARQGVVEALRERVARSYLRERSSRNLQKCDQQVVFSFDWISQAIALDGLYEREELEFISHMFRSFLVDKTILDVGANIGNHTRVFAKIGLHVFAFEPNPVTFAVLKINTAGISNVKILNVGASDATAIVQARTPFGNVGGTAINDRQEVLQDGSKAVAFQVVPLDTLADLAASNLGFVKIDIEGHELKALRGMKNLLTRQNPIVAFEQNSGIVNGTCEVVEFLRDIGYCHLYELVHGSEWYVPQHFPRGLRRPLRAIEALLFGVPPKLTRIRQMEKLDDRRYNLLFASKFPLSDALGPL